MIMRRFVFKLEGVLEQRRQAERQRQRELAQTQRRIMMLQHDLEDVAAQEKLGSTPLRGRVDPRTLAMQVRFWQVMHQKLDGLREQLDAARSELASAQAALVESSKQRKVIEKLQEKQQARWLAEQQKRETAANDEVAQRVSRLEDSVGAGGDEKGSAESSQIPFCGP